MGQYNEKEYNEFYEEDDRHENETTNSVCINTTLF